jgi:hypothetical protein
MWEYVTVSVDTKMQPQSGWLVSEPTDLKRTPWPELSARLDREGWELTAAVPEYARTYTNLEHAHFVFKRPA